MRIFSGTTTVSAAGTAVALSTAATASQRARTLWITRIALNVGTIYIGDSTVTNGTGTAASRGWPLFIGQNEIQVPIPEGGSLSLGDVFINADTAGDGVRWLAVLSQ